MSVRVRYRLTNYRCPSSLPLPLSFFLRHLLLSPPLGDLVRFVPPPPSPLLLSCPVSCCYVYTCCRDWSRGEDKHRGSESGSGKNPKRRRETLTCPLSVCEQFVCSFQASEISSHCGFLCCVVCVCAGWGGPVTEDRRCLDSHREVRDDLRGEEEQGRMRK